MRATLSFSMPEEEEEFNLANNGAHLRSEMLEFEQWLRDVVKYDSTEGKPTDLSLDQWKSAVESVRNRFLSHLDFI